MTKNVKKTRRAPNVLVVITSVLAIAGVMRGGLGAREALASAETAIPEPDACTPVAMPSELARALSDREAAVTAQESALKQRSDDLAAFEESLRREIEKLKSAEAQLASMIAIAESASENDLSRLTAVYEAMKPNEAAALFAEMDPEFAAGFLGRMAPSAAAGVLAGLEPEKAYAMSAHLAGRNARAPKD